MRNLTRIGGAAAIAAALTLTACGGGGATGPETAKGQEAGSDLSKLISINESRQPILNRAAKSPFRWAASARTSTVSPTTATALTTPR
jgi:peptide/nickel transport system substrate-binding protein